MIVYLGRYSPKKGVDRLLCLKAVFDATGDQSVLVDWGPFAVVIE